MASSAHVINPIFNEPDVRRDLFSHLHNVFARKEITMLKEQEMENYASSKCCSDEILEIFKCKEDLGQIVMPIFLFDVGPSDIQKQKGDFWKAFEKICEGVTEEKKRRLMEALTCVATKTGEHSRNSADEAAKLEKISTVMLNKLKAEKVNEEFRIHDVVQNRFITKSEIQYMMTKEWRKVTHREVRKIIKAADFDDDGQSSYDGFFVQLNAEDNIEKVQWSESLPHMLHCHGRKRDKFFNFFGL